MRTWTKEEVEFLKKSYKNLPSRNIALNLGRTQSAVLHKLMRLGLKKTMSPKFSTRALEIQSKYGTPINILLKKLYYEQNKTQKEIARALGIGEGTVASWFSKYGIKRKTLSEIRTLTHSKHIPSKEKIEKLYLTDLKSTNEIAKKYSVTGTTVKRWLKRYKIKARDNAKAQYVMHWDRIPKIPPKRELEKLYLEDDLSTTSLSKIYGVGRWTISKWIEEYGLEKERFEPKRKVLYDLYIKKKLTAKEIGDKFNRSYTFVFRYLKKYNIPIRTATESKYASLGKEVELPTKQECEKLYKTDKFTLAEIAKMFNVGYSTIGRLFRSYNLETRPSSFQYPRYFQCKNGLKVSSSYERFVGDWLINHNIDFKYNGRLDGTRFRYDFKVGDIYIEIWGLLNRKDYYAKFLKKSEYYTKNNLRLLSLYPPEFRLKRVITNKLHQSIIKY